MNCKNNKGITLISMVLTVIIILIITSAMIFNTKNQLAMRSVQSLSNDIETLNAKVDEYYLKYGELPKLCDYTTSANIKLKNKSDFINSMKFRADQQNARLNNDVNENDGQDYVVIDIERLPALTLTYGYDEEYKTVKENKKVMSDGVHVEDEIFVINTRSHQIYFPHGVFVDNGEHKIMYYTF